MFFHFRGAEFDGARGGGIGKAAPEGGYIRGVGVDFRNREAIPFPAFELNDGTRPFEVAATVR
jgi:hypothetical protein